ncbi:methyltransferase [Lapillicoccus sp.]|uniref:methyltransferase n=1 Tax=Lapillicoccus sp. TaxID=1909287 RepID=UPI003265398A
MAEADEVLSMVRGGWVSLCLRATCELGVVDALDQPQDLATLASRCSAAPVTLGRLLRVLVDLGLVSTDGGRYAVTTMGATLRVGDPSGLRHLAMMQTELPNLTAWRHLADAVRRGSAVYQDVNGQTSWEWLAAHPAEEAVFNASMARRAATQAAAVLAGYDFSGVRLVVDVGGGQGAMLAALLAGQPLLRGVVAERPEVAAAATAGLTAAGLGARARGEACDFFAGVPAGGEVYLLSNVLHDWDDPQAVTILRSVHAAMGLAAELLIVENVLDAPGRTSREQRDVHLVDLHMLVMFGARERSQSQYDDLLVAAGFETSTLAPSPNSWNVLLTRPAV